MTYRYKATEVYWANFYELSPSQKESVRDAWEIFKKDPFHPSLGTHKIHKLSARAGQTVYSVVVESNLRVVFLIDKDVILTLDVGTHDVYR